MGLGEEFSKLKFDRRMLKINSELGLLTDEEYKQYVASLEDVSSNSVPLEIEKKSQASAPAPQEESQTVSVNTDPAGGSQGGFGDGNTWGNNGGSNQGF